MCERCCFAPAVVPRTWQPPALVHHGCCKSTARALHGYCKGVARAAGTSHLLAWGAAQVPRHPAGCVHTPSQWKGQLSISHPAAFQPPGVNLQASSVPSTAQACGSLPGRSGVEEGRGMQPRVSASPREAAEQSVTQPLRHLGRGHVILISFFVLNRKGVCGWFFIISDSSSRFGSSFFNCQASIFLFYCSFLRGLLWTIASYRFPLGQILHQTHD